MPTATQPKLLSATSILGDKVRNTEGDVLGDMKDLMIDLNTGRIVYAVLSFGGILGVGDKLFAVPWTVLELAAEEKKFIFDVDKQKLSDAPGFDKDNWPNMADTTWQEEVHQHYEATPYWDDSPHLK